MPVEFTQYPPQENTGSSSDTARLSMTYDVSGRRISKTLLTKSAAATSWDTVKVTHYTGIGTEIREEFHDGSRENVNVVVNMPQGLGRYKVADASVPADDNASRTFEWYLKNHLGSTMLVYGTVASTDPNNADIGETKAAYDYRAFGEMVELVPHDLAKVTENFTGKELDDEIALDYFGARYLDPMLGMWISADPKRFFPSPYLYMGNGYNPIRFADLNGQAPGDPFGSPEEAAKDFARLYNGVSIATSTEYGTIIYRKGNSFSYVTPSFGTSKNVNLDECVMDVAGNAELQLITSAHTHGSYSSFRNLEPSPLDFQSEFVASDYNLYPYYKENIDAPAYVAVPNGKLIEYRSEGSSKEVPSSGIAADPRSGWSDIDERYHADLELLE